MAERISKFIKAVGPATKAAKEFESSMKGVGQAMAKIQPKKLSAHGLGREVVDHYSNLYARRKEENIQKDIERQRKEVRRKAIEKKLEESKSMPKKLRDKLQAEADSISLDAINPFVIQPRVVANQSIPWRGTVIIPSEREHPVRVKEIKLADLFVKEEVEKSVPDVLQSKIFEKAKKILRRNPKLKGLHINAEEFKRRVAEEIEQEISNEEQRDLQEKVVLKRRRKVIRRKD